MYIFIYYYNKVSDLCFSFNVGGVNMTPGRSVQIDKAMLASQKFRSLLIWTFSRVRASGERELNELSQETGIPVNEILEWAKVPVPTSPCGR